MTEPAGAGKTALKWVALGLLVAVTAVLGIVVYTRKPAEQPAAPLAPRLAKDVLVDEPAKRPGRIDARPPAIDMTTVQGTARRSVIEWENVGDEPVRLGGAARLVGEIGAFALVQQDCKEVIAPGARCTATIELRGDNAGRSTGRLVLPVQGDPSASPQVALTASVTEPPAPPPAISPMIIAPAPPPGTTGAQAEPQVDPVTALKADRDRRAGAALSGRNADGARWITSQEAIMRRDAGARSNAGSSQDYGAGTPKRLSSLPVDRERVITADAYIEATLEVAIDSQIGGRATAVVGRNVYGRSGRLIVIPGGSRLVGRYQPLQAQGETRLPILWERIIRPDGIQILIHDPNADLMGRSGTPGDVDDRTWERLGLALTTSIVTGIVQGVATLGQQQSTLYGYPGMGVVQQDTRSAATVAAANSVSQNLGATVNEIAREKLKVRPIIQIPQGTRIIVTPMEDLWLRRVDELDDTGTLELMPVPVAGREPRSGPASGPAQPRGGGQPGIAASASPASATPPSALQAPVGVPRAVP
ncbi:MAG: TrbI/VirB10 family protein [Alphaproteobacteria bacterium]|nr:TrbI/VirB10 family protein [Alphaproteobacteria bacterium]